MDPPLSSSRACLHTAFIAISVQTMSSGNVLFPALSALSARVRGWPLSSSCLAPQYYACTRQCRWWRWALSLGFGPDLCEALSRSDGVRTGHTVLHSRLALTESWPHWAMQRASLRRFSRRVTGCITGQRGLRSLMDRGLHWQAFGRRGWGRCTKGPSRSTKVGSPSALRPTDG